MKETKQVALDGPAGAGKSSVAKKLAQRLGYIYIDTGAMYRAVAYLVLKAGVHVSDEKAMDRLLRDLEIVFGPVEEDGRQAVWCNGENCTEAIRSPAVSNFVSAVSALGPVRQVLVQKQRQIAAGNNVVMDGRDIGTVVLPEAQYKFFLTASLEERARRRMQEMADKGQLVDLEILKAEMAARDKKDSERELAPLVQARDALLIDTSQLTFEQVVDKLFEIIIK